MLSAADPAHALTTACVLVTALHKTRFPTHNVRRCAGCALNLASASFMAFLYIYLGMKFIWEPSHLHGMLRLPTTFEVVPYKRCIHRVSLSCRPPPPSWPATPSSRQSASSASRLNLDVAVERAVRATLKLFMGKSKLNRAPAFSVSAIECVDCLA